MSAMECRGNAAVPCEYRYVGEGMLQLCMSAGRRRKGHCGVVQVHATAYRQGVLQVVCRMSSLRSLTLEQAPWEKSDGGNLREQFAAFLAGFPIDFACRKPLGRSQMVIM